MLSPDFFPGVRHPPPRHPVAGSARRRARRLFAEERSSGIAQQSRSCVPEWRGAMTGKIHRRRLLWGSPAHRRSRDTIIHQQPHGRGSLRHTFQPIPPPIIMRTIGEAGIICGRALTIRRTSGYFAVRGTVRKTPSGLHHPFAFATISKTQESVDGHAVHQAAGKGRRGRCRRGRYGWEYARRRFLKASTFCWQGTISRSRALLRRSTTPWGV